MPFLCNAPTLQACCVRLLVKEEREGLVVLAIRLRVPGMRRPSYSNSILCISALRRWLGNRSPNDLIHLGRIFCLPDGCFDLELELSFNLAGALAGRTFIVRGTNSTAVTLFIGGTVPFGAGFTYAFNDSLSHAGRTCATFLLCHWNLQLQCLSEKERP